MASYLLREDVQKIVKLGDDVLLRNFVICAFEHEAGGTPGGMKRCVQRHVLLAHVIGIYLAGD